MYSDRELIEQANEGDPEAFEAIYYRYRDWVYGLALRFNDNPQDALDVLQETFIYLLGKFPDFELTCSMTTFLYPVVKHTSLAIRNKNRRFVKEIQNGLLELAYNPPDENLSDLSAVLDTISAEQREIVLMRFVDDMNLKEISDALSIPLSTVKSRLYHALETLRNDSKTKSYFLK